MPRLPRKCSLGEGDFCKFMAKLEMVQLRSDIGTIGSVVLSGGAGAAAGAFVQQLVYV